MFMNNDALHWDMQKSKKCMSENQTQALQILIKEAKKIDYSY